MTDDWDYLARGDFVYRDPPIEIERARGATLGGTCGRTWIDLEAANGSALFGYDSSFCLEASEKWAELPALPSFLESEQRRSYAKRLGAIIQEKLGSRGRIAFELGGGQGVELSIRIASRLHPNRRTILVLEGCYHGRTLALSSLSSSLRYRRHVANSGYRIIRLPVPAFYENEKGIGDAISFCCKLAERIFSDQAMGLVGTEESDALALIYEPILNVAGLVDPSAEYLAFLINLAKQNGCITIADEVFSGCHRMGPFLASEEIMSVPDMIIMSKALTNGMVPLSAVWSRGDLAGIENFAPGSYSTTFANNPLHFVLANKVMDRIIDITPANVQKQGEFLLELTNAISGRLTEENLRIAVRGLTASLEFNSKLCRDKVLKKLRLGAENVSHRVGLICASTALCSNKILLHPPINLTSSEKDLALECVYELL